MNIQRAIPTTYKGTRFRSRLEAKWAAFFDVLEWHWEYEPFDCTGWIPDFLLLGRHETLVEVKPITTFDPAIAAEIGATNSDKYELLLLGCAVPPMSMSGLGDFKELFGWSRETPRMGSGEWSDAVLGRWRSQRRFGWCHADGSFVDRISGEYDGGCYGAGEWKPAEIQHAWGLAGAAVQWRGR